MTAFAAGLTVFRFGIGREVDSQFPAKHDGHQAKAFAEGAGRSCAHRNKYAMLIVELGPGRSWSWFKHHQDLPVLPTMCAPIFVNTRHICEPADRTGTAAIAQRHALKVMTVATP
jgi:hypothetical protein